MIKNYLQLTPKEIELVYEFINRNKKEKQSFEKIDKQLRDEIYNFGEGVLFTFYDEKVIGKISLILKSAIKKGVAYIKNLDILEDIKNKKLIVSEILMKAKNIAKNYNASEIYIGTKNEEIITILNSLNLYKQYSAIKMTLEDREVRYNPLKLVSLSENNKTEYIEIFNNAFRDTPNGATLSDKQVNEYIKIADKNNYFFIVIHNNKKIGFLQCNIEDNVGQFDIGLIESARSKGYGKMLLETAIDFLNLQSVEKISLCVVTKNILAYNMYKKRGFKKSQLLSHWFELN